MFIQTWGEVLSTSFQGLWYGFVSFVPQLVIAILIFIIGWMFGAMVGKAIAQLVDALKINKLFESAGANELMNRAGMRLNVSGFVGGLVKWFIIVLFLVASLDVLGLSQVNDFLKESVLFYLPKVVVAALVLIIAGVLADTMKKIVSASAKAASSHSANLLGSIAYYAIWIFAFIIALSELGIGAMFMQILFTGVVAMLALAGGLAFGLGGRDAAARTVEHISRDVSSK